MQMGHAALGTGDPGFLGLILFFKKRHRHYENITVLVMAAVRAWQRPVPHEYPPGPNLLLEEGATEKRGFQGGDFASMWGTEMCGVRPSVREGVAR